MAFLRINQANLDKFFNKIAHEVVAEAQRLAPVDQGDLKRSINVVGNSKIVVNPVDAYGKSYAAAVEFGRAPGERMPPYSAGSRLSIWAGTPGQAVWQLARAIAARGIRAKPFFFPAVKAVATKYLQNVRTR